MDAEIWFSDIIGRNVAGEPLEPAREWVSGDCRTVIDGHTVRVYMRDRVQVFAVRRPEELARRLDLGEVPEDRWRDEDGNRVCYGNAVPYGPDGQPYTWGMVIGNVDGVEKAECFETEQEAKGAGAEAWESMSEDEKRPRYLLVGLIDPRFMISKSLEPMWWPGTFRFARRRKPSRLPGCRRKLLRPHPAARAPSCRRSPRRRGRSPTL